MRIVHTSDWHLGHTLYDVDREREHDAMLAALLDLLAAERADLLLIAGDIFDRAHPSPAALQLWHRFLVQAWLRLPALHVVAIAGNHDSPSRIEASAPLLDAMGRLHVVGGADRGRMVVQVPGAVVAAVPFLRPSELRPGADLAEAVGEVYGEVVAAARERQRPGDALLAMGHCYMVAGQVSEGSERKIQVGNQVALPLAIFPDDLDYVALGHLHLAQRVGGREHVRYAGAPLPLAMDERAYPHAVTLVELEGGRFVGQRQLRLPRARALVRLPERGGLPLAEALAAVAALPPAAAEDAPPQDDWPLVELAVSLDAPEPTLKAQVRAALRGRAARLVRLGVVAGGTGGALVEALAADGEPPPALDALSPAEVFARCWASAHAQPPEAAVQATFAVLEQLAGDPEAAQQARAQRLAALKEAWT